MIHVPFEQTRIFFLILYILHTPHSPRLIQTDKKSKGRSLEFFSSISSVSVNVNSLLIIIIRCHFSIIRKLGFLICFNLAEHSPYLNKFSNHANDNFSLSGCFNCTCSFCCCIEYIGSMDSNACSKWNCSNGFSF